MVEATTMKNSIEIAMQKGFSDINIEENNKILIQTFQNHIQTPWEIQILIQDIYTCVQHGDNVLAP